MFINPIRQICNNLEKVLFSFGNIARQGENAGSQHFFLFPQFLLVFALLH